MSEPVQNQDFIVSELLAELKEGNARKDKRLQEKDKLIWRIILAASIMIVSIVAGFLIYINQYDFSSYTMQQADGVYAIIDSEGNVITSDLTKDQLQQLMGGMYGESNGSESAQED